MAKILINHDKTKTQIIYDPAGKATAIIARDNDNKLVGKLLFNRKKKLVEIYDQNNTLICKKRKYQHTK